MIVKVVMKKKPEKGLTPLLGVIWYAESQNQCWLAEKWPLNDLICIFPRWYYYTLGQPSTKIYPFRKCGSVITSFFPPNNSFRYTIRVSENILSGLIRHSVGPNYPVLLEAYIYGLTPHLLWNMRP